MTSSEILSVKGLHKSFRYYASPLSRLREALTGKSCHQTETVIDDISFSLERGETLAFLGQNGAGKSTLLKLITGILLPDSGTVQKNIRITGLLELGTGFDPNLSGRENIFINGQLIGMDHAEIEHKLKAIMAFAELGEHIHQPVRTYSSGMVMRLGFAIAIHADPGCFVVDEALSVGDIRFQQKCLAFLRQFQADGGSLLFVSHDLAQVKNMCKRAIILDKGKIAYEGTAQEACNRFQAFMLESAPQPQAATPHFPDAGIRLNNAWWWQTDQRATQLISGEWAELRVELTVKSPRENLALGFMIRDRLNIDLFGTNTGLQQIPLVFPAPGHYTVAFPVKPNLGPGEYVLFLALHDQDNFEQNVQFWEQSFMAFQVSAPHRNSVGAVYCETRPPIVSKE